MLFSYPISHNHAKLLQKQHSCKIAFTKGKKEIIKQLNGRERLKYVTWKFKYLLFILSHAFFQYVKKFKRNASKTKTQNYIHHKLALLQNFHEKSESIKTKAYNTARKAN